MNTERNAVLVVWISWNRICFELMWLLNRLFSGVHCELLIKSWLLWPQRSANKFWGTSQQFKIYQHDMSTQGYKNVWNDRNYMWNYNATLQLLIGAFPTPFLHHEAPALMIEILHDHPKALILLEEKKKHLQRFTSSEGVCRTKSSFAWKSFLANQVFRRHFDLKQFAKHCNKTTVPYAISTAIKTSRLRSLTESNST